MARDPDRSKPDGLHWGDYDATGDLPNASGSAVQSQILDYGDVASVAGVLYSCTDPRENGATWALTGGGGTGDVTGPGSSTDNHIARWDGTDGTAIQDSSVEISDVGAMELKGSQPTIKIDANDANTFTFEINATTGPVTMTAFESGVDSLVLVIDPSEATDAVPSVYPNEDSTYDFGSSTKLWKTLRADNLYASTRLDVATELAVTRTAFNYTPVAGTGALASSLLAQSGSTATGSNNGNSGGSLTLGAGDASAGGGTGNTNGGTGGAASLTGGDGAAGSGEGTDGAGGDATVDGGAGAGSADAGDVNLGTTNAARVNISRAAGRIGFYGATAATKQTVSGSTGANAALQSLLTALETLGLITNSTT